MGREHQHPAARRRQAPEQLQAAEAGKIEVEDGLVGSGLRETADGGAPNGVSLPVYVVVNFALQQKVTVPGAGPLTLRFDVINPLDAVYELRDGTGVGVGAPQWGARRGVIAGISKHF